MEDKTYTVKEASELLGLESYTLRYYEEELELQIPRNAMGHRSYREYDMKVFRHIINLKEQGLQLKAIRNAIRGAYNPVGEDDWEEEGETYLQAITSLETTNHGFLGEPVISGVDITDRNNTKVEQFRLMMKETFIQAIDENQAELKSELNYHIKYKIEEDMKEEIQKIGEIYEAKDKERYRKIDETMREMQKIRNEIASVADQKKEKRSLFGKLFGKKDIEQKEYILK